MNVLALSALVAAVAGAASSEETASIRGLVRAEGGDPVSGATVLLHKALEAEDRGPEPVSAISRTIADRHGRFVFPSLRSGRYRLTAIRRGHVAASGRIVLASEHTAADETLVLGLVGASLSGKVTDVDGRSLGHARVRLTDFGGTASTDPYPTYETTTDARGRFLMTVPLGGYLLDVEHEAGRAVPSQIHLGRNLKQSVIVHPYQPLLVRVLSSKGAPVQDAEVWLSSFLGERRRILHVQRGRTGVTGQLSFDRAAIGTHWVVARSGPEISKSDELLTVDGQDVKEVTLRLEAGRRISGRVLDESGHAVAGCRVTAVHANAPFYESPGVTTDPQGLFGIDGLLVGGVKLLVDADQYLPAAVRSVDTFSSTEHTIAIARAVSVVGLLKRDGRPAADGEILVEAKQNSGAAYSAFRRFGRSGADGHFEVLAPSNSDVIVYARHSGGIAQTMVGVGSHSAVVSLNIDSGSRVLGSVLYDDGGPAAGVRVEALPLVDGARRGIGRVFSMAGGVAITDQNGRYSLGALAPQDYLLVGVRDGDLSISSAPMPYQTRVRIGGDGAVTAAPLEVRRGGRIIKIRVDDMGGRPRSGVLVVAHEEITPRSRLGTLEGTAARTDRYGRAMLEGLPHGRFAVSAIGSGLEANRVYVDTRQTAECVITVGEARASGSRGAIPDREVDSLEGS